MAAEPRQGDRESSQLQDLQLGEVEETGRELGRGAYGVVIELKVKGLRCAGKTLHSSLVASSLDPTHREAMRARYAEECRQHAALRHPSIVQLVGLHMPQGALLPTLVMECLHVTLSTCLDKQPDLPACFKRQILLDVGLGLRFLHERPRPIIHRDLTANNVLLTEDLRAKISDLGMARLVPTDVLRKMTTAPGTVDYMPPEAMVADAKYDTSLDMFSFGVLVLHVVAQQWPTPHLSTTFQDVSGSLRARTEAERRAKYFQEMAPDDVLRFLAEKCLEFEPSARLSAAQVVERLQTVVSPVTSSSFPLLEAVRERKEAESERARLERHCQDMECQLHTVIQDLQGKFTLNEPQLDQLIGQLQAVARATRSVLHPAELGDPAYDSTHQRFVVAYRPPLLVTATGSGGNGDQPILSISTATPTPHPLSVTLCAPVNMTFSGTYVKTVVEGLKKSMGMAVSGDELYVVDNEGWYGVHICSISNSDIPKREIVQSSSRKDIYGMPMERCWYPSGVAVDSDKNVILVDTFSHRVVKFSPDGTLLGSTGKLMEEGDAPGEFNKPMGVGVASNGYLYVCDRSNHRVQVLNENMLSVQCFGQLGSGRCEFHHPWDVAFDSRGNVYVVDCSNYCVKVFSRGFGEFLRQVGKEGVGDADFQAPTSICIDSNDFLYVTDKRFCCVKVFDPRGKFVMKFGSSKVEEKPEFRFNKPMGITLDSRGRVFVSDSYNGRVLMFE